MVKCSICGTTIKNRGGLVVHEKTCNKVFPYQENIINLYVIELYSINTLRKKYSVGSDIIVKILGSNLRNKEESNKLISLKNRNKKHTDQSKNKIRIAHIKYLKENPGKTAWRLSNLSYPEKIFLNKLNDLKLKD